MALVSKQILEALKRKFKLRSVKNYTVRQTISPMTTFIICKNMELLLSIDQIGRPKTHNISFSEKYVAMRASRWRKQNLLGNLVCLLYFAVSFFCCSCSCDIVICVYFNLYLSIHPSNTDLHFHTKAQRYLLFFSHLLTSCNHTQIVEQNEEEKQRK